mmetsp:Transcript_91592/g.158532  ORF Transcript_91592/g.158532 Transcript_91592/m.158532 type:complete len:83 (-) Transcript_91592:54-302(-)
MNRALAEKLSQPFDEAESKANFTSADLNTDSKVSIQEFLQFTSTSMVQPFLNQGASVDEFLALAAEVNWELKKAREEVIEPQ